MKNKGYRVTADIEYLDGWLANMVLPAGYSVTVPDRSSASRLVRFLAKVRAEHDFMRAVVTGNRYRIVSEPSVIEV